MTFGSLFAGIGGLDLGLERAGLECRWQVEINPYARRVLAKHWPGVPRHDDVRSFPPDPIKEWTVDAIVGGFPCQDVSPAGPKHGIEGSRSGLWREYVRVIGLLRPRFVIVENSAALLDRGIDRVLGDLAALGFDAEWSVVSACALGAPHTRERLFILAHSNQEHGQPRLGFAGHAERAGQVQRDRLPQCRRDWLEAIAATRGGPDGFPDWMDRLACLGNAVVPQVAEWIGRRLMEATR